MNPSTDDLWLELCKAANGTGFEGWSWHRAADKARELLQPGHEDMRKALLAVEWGQDGLCPYCSANPEDIGFYGHCESCVVDEALTKAGLDTKEKRDAARKKVGL